MKGHFTFFAFSSKQILCWLSFHNILISFLAAFLQPGAAQFKYWKQNSDLSKYKWKTNYADQKIEWKIDTNTSTYTSIIIPDRRLLIIF